MSALIKPQMMCSSCMGVWSALLVAAGRNDMARHRVLVVP
jgi:hypothetical protein